MSHLAGQHESGDSPNRRRYARLRAPLYWRPARFRTAHRPVVDVGLEGLRIYSDEDFILDDRLSVELFFPSGESLTFVVRVAWTSALPAGGPARYDVGLQLLDAEGDGFALLAKALEGMA